MNEIKLVQLPVISHALKLTGEEVTKRIAELNIDGQVPTLETVKFLKSLRAELNKELKDYEDQRGVVKKAILAPYNDFEGLYKSEVSEKYTDAINTLKNKIDQVENLIRAEKKAEVMEYFAELLRSENIDFVDFNQVGIKIDLSTTLKEYKTICRTFVERVVSDLDLIKSFEFQAEILAEYKKTLNCSGSIKTVQDRKERERLEIERLKIQETNRRQIELKKLGFEWVSFTETYEKDELCMSKTSLIELSKEDFNLELVKFQEAINLKKQPDLFTPSAPVAEPLQSPEIVKPVELLTASFQVTGTKEQFLNLKKFLIANNIQYLNI